MGGPIPATIRKASILVGRVVRQVVLHPGDATLMMRMACWVAILSALVKLTSLPRALQAVSTRVRWVAAANEAVPVQLAQAIDLLLGVEFLVFRRSCWKRAAILHRYLALNGIDSRINFGVRKESGGKVSGHAWLESRGETLLEDTAPEYTVTFGFPSKDPLKDQANLPPEILES